MAKTSVRARAAKRIKLCSQYRERRAAIKSLRTDPSQAEGISFKVMLDLQKLPRDSSKTRIRNRCALTGRPRGYLRRFGVSRIKLREIAVRGEIPGLTLSSW